VIAQHWGRLEKETNLTTKKKVVAHVFPFCDGALVAGILVSFFEPKRRGHHVWRERLRIM
jgi:hypothetical protein